jgi:hypothetical protein
LTKNTATEHSRVGRTSCSNSEKMEVTSFH